MTSIPPLRTLNTAADALSWLVRAPPTAPDGMYDSEDQIHSGDDLTNHSAVTNAIGDVEILAPKGQEDPDPLVIAGFLDAVVHPNASPAPRAPPVRVSARQENRTLMLYDTIPHPVATTLGPGHAFRQADGGGNNVINPDIGRAGTPYARTLQSHTPISPTALPDPGLMFYTLMRARDVRTTSPRLFRLAWPIGLPLYRSLNLALMAFSACANRLVRRAWLVLNYSQSFHCILFISLEAYINPSVLTTTNM